MKIGAITDVTFEKKTFIQHIDRRFKGILHLQLQRGGEKAYGGRVSPDKPSISH